MRKILLYVFAAGCFFTYLKIHNVPIESSNLDRGATIEKNKKIAEEPEMDHPELFADLMSDMRTKVGEEFPSYAPGYKMTELKSAKKRMIDLSSTKRQRNDLTFIERGPNNVPGRTRGIIVDPNDATGNTWIGAAVGGGLWKTTDAGDSWVDLTPDFPNLAMTYMAMSESNNDVIYAGTGEGFFASVGMVDGDGIFKSTDGGTTWAQLESTTDEDFFGVNVNRIIVDPNNVNILLVATISSVWTAQPDRVSSILKSMDGGTSWTKMYESANRIQDLIYDPNNFNIQYAGENGVGTIKSTDGGATWSLSNAGMRPTGRVELAISRQNSNRLFASTEGGQTGTGSDLYVSDDAGQTWSPISREDGNNADFLGGQGWYDNCLVVHPFDEDIAYVGGVHLFKYTVTDEILESSGTVTGVDENGTEGFFDVTNFSAPYYRGGLDISEDAANREYVSVELRFGPGRSQMAHRFHVPDGQGSGVDDSDYTYQDYVEVPFEAWDIVNDRQLMVSFRDQQRDGTFDLLEANTNGDASTHSREYIYISQEDYDAVNPSPTIAVDAGHVASDLYFLWPILAEGGDSDPTTWPESEIVINWEEVSTRKGTFLNVADAYGDFEALNQYVHPDHHDYAIIIDDEQNQEFRILNSTDGGIFMTNSGTDPGTQEGDWKFTGNGYNTSQFYGADKAPGVNRYFGGMQDNGTYQSPEGEDASADTDYLFRIGGDGYETIWHSGDINKMIGGFQFNGFRRSIDGGETFINGTNGLADTGSGNAPFVSKLANSKQNPNLIYTVGPSGVWRSDDFGANWRLSEVDLDRWLSFSNIQVEVSLADRKTVWAGGHMQQGSHIQVSTDNGLTFSATNNYDGVALGRVSGLSTHPSDPNTAYVCFSFAETPKILKTTDLGQTWSDITGFGNDGGVSDNGFPDVATHCVLVMPHDTDWIWAGTEIGIVESTDGGDTWSLLESNFPSVSVWQMQVQDDQVVIATHGRGIWSVTIDGIDANRKVIVPAITQVAESPQQELIVIASLYEQYDRLEAFLGGELQDAIDDPQVGDQTLKFTGITTFGEKEVTLTGYIDGVAYESDPKTIDFFEAELVDGYGSKFEQNADDFTGDALSFQTGIDGFSQGAIHSLHPYLDQRDLVYVLKRPIRIASSDAFFRYEDIAIIEPGETGTVFGDDQFWDYVIVEGTTDGLNWVPILDGYDADFLSSWRSKYNANIPPTEADYRGHDINLLDTFDPGDEVLFRFRLFADQLTNGWGWAINKVFIQEEEEEEVTGFEDDILNQKQAIRTYPNPVQLNTTIEFYMPQRGQASIEMIDMNGKLIFENNLGIRDRGLNSMEWSRTGLEQGIYILKLHTLNGDATTRVQLN